MELLYLKHFLQGEPRWEPLTNCHHRHTKCKHLSVVECFSSLKISQYFYRHQRLWKVNIECSTDEKMTCQGFWKRRNSNPLEYLLKPCKNAISWIITIFLHFFFILENSPLPGWKHSSQSAVLTAEVNAFLLQGFAEFLTCTHAEERAPLWVSRECNQ